MSSNVSSFYDVCRPAARQVGTCFCECKNRDKGKCGRGRKPETQGVPQARRSVKTLLAEMLSIYTYINQYYIFLLFELYHFQILYQANMNLNQNKLFDFKKNLINVLSF